MLAAFFSAIMKVTKLFVQVLVANTIYATSISLQQRTGTVPEAGAVNEPANIKADTVSSRPSPNKRIAPGNSVSEQAPLIQAKPSKPDIPLRLYTNGIKGSNSPQPNPLINGLVRRNIASVTGSFRQAEDHAVKGPQCRSEKEDLLMRRQSLKSRHESSQQHPDFSAQQNSGPSTRLSRPISSGEATIGLRQPVSPGSADEWRSYRQDHHNSSQRANRESGLYKRNTASNSQRPPCAPDDEKCWKKREKEAKNVFVTAGAIGGGSLTAIGGAFGLHMIRQHNRNRGSQLSPSPEAEMQERIAAQWRRGHERMPVSQVVERMPHRALQRRNLHTESIGQQHQGGHPPHPTLRHGNDNSLQKADGEDGLKKRDEPTKQQGPPEQETSKQGQANPATYRPKRSCNKKCQRTILGVLLGGGSALVGGTTIIGIVNHVKRQRRLAQRARECGSQHTSLPATPGRAFELTSIGSHRQHSHLTLPLRPLDLRTESDLAHHLQQTQRMLASDQGHSPHPSLLQQTQGTLPDDRRHSPRPPPRQPSLASIENVD